MNNIKLGVFTIAGLLFLILLLYMIGKNKNLFGDTYILKARFENIQGLIEGNNVRYAGIETGTVKDISIINDTTLEITMVIEKAMRQIIKKNAMVSVGTEGFVGNKVVNITPSRQPAALAVEGDILLSKRSVSLEDMLEKLSGTNNDIGEIVAELKSAIHHINSSEAFWSLLNDKGIPVNVKLAAANVRSATERADAMVKTLQEIAKGIQAGKGSAGSLLKDTLFAFNLNESVLKIKTAGVQADSMIAEVNKTIRSVRQDIENGKGMANAVLRDSLMVQKLSAIINNMQQGTDGFNQNMEALKHNFLFRGYFKKLEKQNRKIKAETINR